MFAAGLNQLYRASGTGLFNSGDQGRTWSAHEAPAEITGLAAHPEDDSRLHVLTAGRHRPKLYQVWERGGGWQCEGEVPSRLAGKAGGPVNNGVGLSGSVTPILALPGRPPALLLAYEGRIVRFTSGGEGWKESRVPEGVASINCLCLDPDTPDILYAGTGRGALLRSMDRGRSFSQVGIITAKRRYRQGYQGISSILVDPGLTVALYMGIDVICEAAPAFSGVYASEDRGNTLGLTPLSGHCVYKLAINEAVLFAGCRDGLCFSRDHGLNWEYVEFLRGKPIRNAIAGPGDWCYIEVSGIIYRTRDGTKLEKTGAIPNE